MKHITIGTAGHVDHGKTALIKAITGFDCDTHKAEKERGITINLGFTHISLPSGNTVGIIDVPGHEDFIHTMVEGAMGIDLGLLVIAANEGIMQQTKEHINIMDILNIKQTLIVITKIDLVDEPTLNKVEIDIQNYLAATHLKNAPIIKVSAITKHGIDTLINKIDNLTLQQAERPATGPFRMFIDRIFSKAGFGVIITGSAINGKLTTNTPVYLLPDNNTKISIKSIQRFGKEVNEISSGDRTAINLTGIKANELKRGMAISDRQLNATSMIDVKITLNKERITLRSHSDVMLQTGDYNFKVSIHILTADILHGEENGFAQIKLPTQCILRYGDRFIIRSSSGDKTLGGGYILDTNPLHHRKRRETVTNALTLIDNNGLPALIAQKVKQQSIVLTLNKIADELNFSEDELTKQISNLPDDIICKKTDTAILLYSNTTADKFRENIINTLTSFFANNPFAGNGLTKQELAISLQIKTIPEQAKSDFIDILLAELNTNKQLEQKGNTWTLPGYPKTDNNAKNQKQIDIENFIRECGENIKVPTNPELEELRTELNINEKEFKQIIAQLIKDKIIYSSEKAYIHAATVNRTREQIIESLINNESGITVAEFRDLIGGNRKICLALLTLFDNERTTIRKDNYRFLTAKATREYNS